MISEPNTVEGWISLRIKYDTLHLSCFRMIKTEIETYVHIIQEIRGHI
jgi:hypothetical protein